MLPGEMLRRVHIILLVLGVSPVFSSDSGDHVKRLLQSNQGEQSVRVKSDPSPLYAPDFLVIGEYTHGVAYCAASSSSYNACSRLAFMAVAAWRSK